MLTTTTNDPQEDISDTDTLSLYSATDHEDYLLRLTASTTSTFLPPQAPPRIGTVTTLTFQNFTRTIQIAEDASTGCGGKTWEAATVLSNHLLWLGGGWLKGKRVLEVGAGTGCVGIMAGMLLGDGDHHHHQKGAFRGSEGVDQQQEGSEDRVVEDEEEEEEEEEEEGGEVVITDMLFLDLMQRNVNINLSPAERKRVKVEYLKWGEPIPPAIKPPYDIILAADCVYLEVAFDPLISTLLELSDENTQIIIVSKKRRKADKRFFEKLKKKFDVTEVDFYSLWSE
ncbi:hypothetical protein HDV05_006359 [Chytridiales sp. JEL 0842]|nr:hypothetical protein HDV05_006359 [Chytridiales sp. JEL 0842]